MLQTLTLRAHPNRDRRQRREIFLRSQLYPLLHAVLTVLLPPVLPDLLLLVEV
jgi:hypothetical protein